MTARGRRTYDPSMRGRLLGVAVLVVVAVAGCAEDADPVPRACFEGPATMLSALERAPGAVALADGTRLSRCVSSARSEGDLQSLGVAFVRVADALRGRAGARPDAALRLGYLAGAVKAGAARSSGSIAAQLARRVEQVATLEQGASASAAAALARGRRAGERGG